MLSEPFHLRIPETPMPSIASPCSLEKAMCVRESKRIPAKADMSKGLAALSYLKGVLSCGHKLPQPLVGF